MSWTIYTDGGAKPNPGAGGWGFAVYDKNDKEVYEVHGGEEETTNNRMEMTAILEALYYVYIYEAYPCTIVTDSMYCCNALSGKPKTPRSITLRDGWIRGWKRKNYLGVANEDLWRIVDSAVDDLEGKVRIVWTKAHCGTIGNERADALATLGRDELR